MLNSQIILPNEQNMNCAISLKENMLMHFQQVEPVLFNGCGIPTITRTTLMSLILVLSEQMVQKSQKQMYPMISGHLWKKFETFSTIENSKLSPLFFLIQMTFRSAVCHMR